MNSGTLLSALVSIVNSSLATGSFPASLKETIVSPILYVVSEVSVCLQVWPQHGYGIAENQELHNGVARSVGGVRYH